MVGPACATAAQVDRHAREPCRRVLAGQLHVHVLVDDRHAGVAARIERVGGQGSLIVRFSFMASPLEIVPCRGETGAELLTGVEQGLVNGVTVGVQPQS